MAEIHRQASRLVKKQSEHGISLEEFAASMAALGKCEKQAPLSMQFAQTAEWAEKLAKLSKVSTLFDFKPCYRQVHGFGVHDVPFDHLLKALLSCRRLYRSFAYWSSRLSSLCFPHLSRSRTLLFLPAAPAACPEMCWLNLLPSASNQLQAGWPGSEIQLYLPEFLLLHLLQTAHTAERQSSHQVFCAGHACCQSSMSQVTAPAEVWS